MIKVKNIRCHVGAQIGAEVLTSLDEEKHRCKLYMTNTGVFVIGYAKGGKVSDPTFIPHSTIASITLGNAAFEEIIGKTETREDEPTKRGPGRPAKNG